MAFLIDSNVFIGMERRRLGIADLPSVGPDEPVALASITASELLIGVMRSAPSPRTAQRVAFVEAVCRLLPVLPFDLPAAREHARIWFDLAMADTPIGSHDMLIAATALANDYSVLTDNVREFERVSGPVVIQPTRPT